MGIKTQYSQKTINAAIKADLNARRYVLGEKLKRVTTCEEYTETMDILSAIEYRIECLEIRNQMKKRFHLDALAHQWNRAAQEVSTTITHK